MSYKIVASDLDGTLFNKKGEISEQNAAAIKELYDMGVHFVPSSGRSYQEMPQVLKDNPYIRYYIGSDGSTVYDKETDKTYSLNIPKELCTLILDKLYSYDINMMLHADNRSYVDAAMHDAATYKTYNYSDNWIKFAFETNTPVDNFKEFCYSKAVEMFCVFFKDYNDLLECKEFFGAHPDLLVAQSHKHNLEIFSKNAGKGNALKLLAGILDVDIKDTIAVGDSTNDLTMIKDAGLGLAMDNAVSELKAVADKVICDNNEHSAKYILENFIK